MERAIDVGYGWTKYSTGHAHRIKDGIVVEVNAFQSLPMSVIGENPDVTITDESEGNSVVVRLNGSLYKVSDQPSYSAEAMRIGGVDYSASDQYAVCMAAAAKAMQVDLIDHLVVGTPVANFQTAKAILKEKFGKGIAVDNKVIEVKNLHVVVQPVGGLVWHYYSKGRQAELDKHPRVLVDVGYGTLDWVAVEGLKTNFERCGSAPFGVGRFINQLSEAIKGQKSLEPWFADRIDQMLINDKRIAFDGKEHCREQYETLIDQIATVGVQHMQASLGDLRLYQSVVLMGGGARLYQRALTKAFKAIQVEVVSGARYANVRGFQLLAERQARIQP